MPRRDIMKKSSSSGANDIAGQPLGESLGYLFRDTYRRISRHLLLRIEAHGIGLGHWYFLRALWAEDGITQRELAARVGMGEPTAVTALRSLEKLGLIRRAADATDLRCKRVFLTRKGAALKERLLPVVAEINAQAAAQLSDAETRQLKALIRRVRDTFPERE
jgi:DNA-binding MarR family transcriptional regulator